MTCHQKTLADMAKPHRVSTASIDIRRLQLSQRIAAASADIRNISKTRQKGTKVRAWPILASRNRALHQHLRVCKILNNSFKNHVGLSDQYGPHGFMSLWSWIHEGRSGLSHMYTSVSISHLHEMRAM